MLNGTFELLWVLSYSYSICSEHYTLASMIADRVYIFHRAIYVFDTAIGELK